MTLIEAISDRRRLEESKKVSVKAVKDTKVRLVYEAYQVIEDEVSTGASQGHEPMGPLALMEN